MTAYAYEELRKESGMFLYYEKNDGLYRRVWTSFEGHQFHSLAIP
jgi:hypothetical protein